MRISSSLRGRLSRLLAFKSIHRLLQGSGPRQGSSQPNLPYFNGPFRDQEIATLNIKQLGYELGRRLAKERFTKVVHHPPPVALGSKLCTQADMESDWVAFWCAEIKSAPVYHRKLWEFCYIAQALWHANKLSTGSTGVAFGCGNEPLPSLFAKYGCAILATDLPPQRAEALGWQHTNQHMSEASTARRPDICADEHLLAQIAFRPVDMNDLPADLAGRFDFCWSACALEHLGSIAKGLTFIERSLNCLKPGGIAVHTTEFTFGEGETIDHEPTVLFQRRHIEEIVARLRKAGHQVAELDFSPGGEVLDGFVDIPPFLPNLPSDAHLKLSIDGFVCTSIGLIVTRRMS